MNFIFYNKVHKVQASNKVQKDRSSQLWYGVIATKLAHRLQIITKSLPTLAQGASVLEHEKQTHKLHAPVADADNHITLKYLRPHLTTIIITDGFGDTALAAHPAMRIGYKIAV